MASRHPIGEKNKKLVLEAMDSLQRKDIGRNVSPKEIMNRARARADSDMSISYYLDSYRACVRERHLEMVQMLAEDGVEFFIAGFWSSHFGGSLEYIDQNDLLMVSPSSTVPAFALPARA